MSKLRIRKLCLNICVGESGDRLTRAAKVLEQLTGQTPVYSKAQHTIRSFGIRRNENIGVCCTVRGEKAQEILEQGLKIKEFQLNKQCFNDNGTFGFGIEEHIDLGIKYDPTIGIFGINFLIVLGRAGFDINNKKHQKSPIGKAHCITKIDTMKWFQQIYDGILISFFLLRKTKSLLLYMDLAGKLVTSGMSHASNVSEVDPCSGCENPCSIHQTYPPEITAQIDLGKMSGSVESHRRHLCIGQNYESAKWPKDVKNLNDYVEQLTKELKNFKDYSVKLTATSTNVDSNDADVADWYLFPDLIRFRNVRKDQITKLIQVLFVDDQSIIKIKDKQNSVTNQLAELNQSNKMTTNFIPALADIQHERLTGVWLLICCHKTRDERCGVAGPILVEECQKYIQGGNKDVHTLKISHIGGHKFAGNVIVYPNGVWYGRVLSCHIPLIIEAYSDGNDEKKQKLTPLLRGQLDMSWKRQPNMNHNSWQTPFVNIFKHFEIQSWKKSSKQGDVSALMDRDLKSTVFRIRGLIPANNFIQFPSQLSQSLGLTGRFFYILFHSVFDKFFSIHLDIMTHENHLVRISLSNLFREFKVSTTCIQFPYMTSNPSLAMLKTTSSAFDSQIKTSSIDVTSTESRWCVLCLDLEKILSTYMTNQRYHYIKSFQLCGNIFVKNCFTSDNLYEPGVTTVDAKRSVLTKGTGVRSLPKELAYPLGKNQQWHDIYDYVMFPSSSSTGCDSNQFERVRNIHSSIDYKANENGKSNGNITVNDDIGKPSKVQTKAANGHLSCSSSDLQHINQRTILPNNNQESCSWTTYNDNRSPYQPLPTTINDQQPSTSRTNNSEGVHLFANHQTINFNNCSIHDDNDYNDFSLEKTIDENGSHLLTRLLPDPILRLKKVIGIGIAGDENATTTSGTCKDILWTHDGDYILYPSNALVIMMHIETRQQYFFIGHTDKVTSIALKVNSTLLATVQKGSNAILRIWKLESRRCIAVVKVPAIKLCAVDFALDSNSLVVVGHSGVLEDKQNSSKTIVCVYDTLNCLKGTINLISKTSTDSTIERIKFVPYDSSKFVTCGRDNIKFWRLKNSVELKSMSISVDDIQHLEYTDIRFEYITKTNLNQNNELLLYISSKSGHVLELSYNEKRVLRIHRLLLLKRPTGSSDKMTLANAPSIGVNALTVTSNFCITGSNDGYVRVWSNDFQQAYIEVQHDNSICGIAISDDQTRVLVSTVSGSLGILNLVNKNYSTLIRSHINYVNDIDYDDIKKQMISVSSDGTIRIWSFETGEQLYEFTSLNDTPLLLTYHPNKQAFAAGFNNGAIKIFELNTSIISAEVKHHTSSITGLLYSHNGFKLLSSDSDGNLCLSDVNDGYKLQRTIAKALPVINSKLSPNLRGNLLAISPDGKHTAYIGPTEFVVTVVETNNLNQTLRIDISSCVLNDTKTVDESAVLVRYSPSKHLLVATSNQKLLKLDSQTGKLLNIINCTHRRSFDSLALSSDSQYLITSGDKLIKFWDYSMSLDINFQSFVGHSEPVRKLFFTPDNMNVISIGDSICIWDVLAWSTPLPLVLDNAQCIVPPQSVMKKMHEQDDTVNGMPRHPPQPFNYHATGK
ncbi:unnamed protein product [Didymodactylos carnosus]|uniref:Large ribosomal subunit protein uL5 n=1 Tax=Didymodactylos carnosus TaxID=1234261 RepID=A0A8S2H2D8_9BILA|nr:unnamed protein product [Didymodactylos carnosus]CAF3584863.1 unnamed protein product [Didymodactylos carnosus]